MCFRFVSGIWRHSRQCPTSGVKMIVRHTTTPNRSLGVEITHSESLLPAWLLPSRMMIVIGNDSSDNPAPTRLGRRYGYLQCDLRQRRKNIMLRLRVMRTSGNDLNENPAPTTLGKRDGHLPCLLRHASRGNPPEGH